MTARMIRFDDDYSSQIGELDPYFYERKKHIAKTIEDIDSGKIKCYDWDEFEEVMDRFEEELTLKYGS